jgi:outer membrane beta-barrel protein
MPLAPSFPWRLIFVGLTCTWLLAQAEEPAGAREPQEVEAPGDDEDAAPQRVLEDAPARAIPDAGLGTEVMQLVSGAPLLDPNVAVHTVEMKPYPDVGRLEVVLFPLALQLNGKFTQHFGTMGSIVWHLHENFSLELTGGGNWYSEESAFNQELANRASVEAQAASSLLWTWGIVGGVEVTPVYGKFALFEATLVQSDLVVNGGAGIGGTRHLLKPGSEGSPASYGDTGTRFLGSLGAGFRVRLGQHFALRLEVRDVVYTARVAAVFGCGAGDLEAMLSAASPEAASVGSRCDLAAFKKASGAHLSTDLNLALNLVRGDNGVPSSDVLNNVGLYLGASFTF